MARKRPELPVIELVMQKDIADCAIAALASVLQKPYREVSDAALRVRRAPHKRGLFSSEMVRIGDALGKPLRITPKRYVDLDDRPTGVLCVRFKTSGHEHAVVLFDGVIYNPADGLLYRSDVYLERADIVHLIELKDG
jgi:ABC-type bacteriocin/lantibiotic exporter with double-glycine peptidase domain